MRRSVRGEMKMGANSTERIPAYQNICASTRGFNLFKNSAWVKANAHPGQVVASHDAFYFAVDLARVPSAAMVGGAIGGILSRKPAQQKIMPQSVAIIEETDLAKLPAAVTGHPDWPVTWSEGPVIVVPRKAVLAVTTSFWTGGIDIDVDDVVMRVFTPIFKRKKLAAYLVQLEWEVSGI